jgi:predicted metal-dependent hydrolase
LAEARRFVERNVGWLAERVQQARSNPTAASEWTLGTRILFRGEETPIELDSKQGQLRLGEFVFPAPSSPGVALRHHVRRALHAYAAVELPQQVIHLAAQFGFTVKRITVRDQRTRWGSCSARKTISLNWRLVQTPPYVVDYIILHELAHTRHMNHSAEFWAEVARVCPDYPAAEAWLKQFGRQLL